MTGVCRRGRFVPSRAAVSKSRVQMFRLGSLRVLFERSMGPLTGIVLAARAGSRFDVVTPMDAAWKLKTAWPHARFEVVWDAGHASTEPGIVDALVRATDQALAVR